jgi:hypothetical protein
LILLQWFSYHGVQELHKLFVALADPNKYDLLIVEGLRCILAQRPQPLPIKLSKWRTRKLKFEWTTAKSTLFRDAGKTVDV